MNDNSLWQLITVRFKEYTREPEALFWSFGFPILLAIGLGIAFRAKPKLQAVASMSLNHNERLDTLLYLMGWNERDLRTV